MKGAFSWLSNLKSIGSDASRGNTFNLIKKRKIDSTCLGLKHKRV